MRKISGDLTRARPGGQQLLPGVCPWLKGGRRRQVGDVAGTHIPCPRSNEPTFQGAHVSGNPHQFSSLSPSWALSFSFRPACGWAAAGPLDPQFSRLHESSSLPASLAERSPEHSWGAATLRGIHVTRCQRLPTPNTKQTRGLRATGKPHGHGQPSLAAGLGSAAPDPRGQHGEKAAPSAHAGCCGQSSQSLGSYPFL